MFCMYLFTYIYVCVYIISSGNIKSIYTATIALHMYIVKRFLKPYACVIGARQESDHLIAAYAFACDLTNVWCIYACVNILHIWRAYLYMTKRYKNICI